MHLGENKLSARRDSINGRAWPPGEAGRPTRSSNVSPTQRCEQLKKIADWLDVKTSARYQRTTVTFCNVYACDYCYLAGVYLPRVWWTDKALASISKGSVPPVAYDQTVREMRADDLHNWLMDYGQSFGWRRVFDLDALQNAANGGGVGLICADREAEGKPGHITVVVPEDDTHRAQRHANGSVTQPLQTQAGASNYRYGSAGPSWWLSPQFRSFVFYVHD